MGRGFAAIWRCRYFWLSLVKIDLRTRYRGSMLGLGWALLRPCIMTAILCMIFHRIFQVEISYYAPFLLTGMACWHFLISVTLQGGQCFFQGESYLRQYPTPIAIYPLRITLGAMVHLLLALGVALLLAGGLNGIPSPAALLTLIPGLVLLFVLGWSLAILAGFANVFFRDTQQLTEIGLQVLFYATPIMYPSHTLRHYHLEWLVTYNPIAAFLNVFRQPLVDGQFPSLATVGMALATTALVTAAASWTLAKGQRRLIFYL